MHWLRGVSVLNPLEWLALSGLWWAGGWLVVRHGFGLQARERPVAGLATGMLLWIVTGNLVGQVLPLGVALWVSGGLVLALGAVCKLRSPDSAWFDRGDLRHWPQIAAFLGLTILFALINRGLATLDDYHNLPLVSVIAAGDVPPHFYLDTSVRLAYHYGLHLFAASLVRIAGFTPWGAFDLSKAISLAFAVSLAWSWFRRMTHSELGAYAGASLALLGGGARWLLLLLPPDWLIRISSDIRLIGSARASGPDLYTALASVWKVEGGGPLQFPFAFANGIFVPNVFAMGGPGAMPALTLVLLLLLARRRWAPLPGLLFGLVLVSLALTAEHLFVLLVVGFLFALGLDAWRARSLERVRSWAWVLIPALILAAIGGGVLTEIGLGWLAGGSGANPSGLEAFALRWPPAILSSHLGRLALSSPSQLLVALVEIGPLVLLGPWVTVWAWKRAWRGRYVDAAAGLAAILGLLLPLVLSYVESDRDISRVTGSALYIWLLLGFPLAWLTLRKGGQWLRFGLGALIGASMLSGTVLLAIMLVAIPRPQFSYFIDIPDVLLSQAYWNRLQPGSQILDPLAYRAITLFGRGGGHAAQNLYTYFPEWSELWEDPDPVSMAQAGYGYLYFDKSWWRDLQPEQRTHFEVPCVKQVAEQTMPDRDFRRLLDIRDCGP